MKNYFFVFTIFISILASATNEPQKADTKTQSSSQSKAVCSEPTKTDQCTSFYETLTKERDYLTGQADKHRTEFWDQVEFFLKWVGFLTALIAIVLGFLGFSSWKQMKEQLLNTINDLFDKEAKSFIFETKMIVTEEANSFKDHLKSIDREIKELTSYKQKNIVWITDSEGSNSDRTINDEEIHALYAHGFQGIKIIAPTQDQDDQFEVGTSDLVILTYKKTDRCQKRLRRVIALIKNQNPPTYLIIYTFNKDGTQVRIDEVEKNILHGFIWYMLANFPATVIAHAQLLVRQADVLERN